MENSLTSQLVHAALRPVSDEARYRAATHILDWLGTVLAGRGTKEGQILTAYGRTAGAGPCTVVGAGARDAPTASFIHGGLGITLELDDTHHGARLHPGDVVIPAALAVAQEVGSSSLDFLDAVVRGYEAVIRVGESVGPGHYRFWHPTSTCGPFGSAMAAGSLLGLSEAKLVAALGNAGTQACGPWQCRDEMTMSKVVHAGRAAQSGVVSAKLAELGLTGPARILEGPLGLYAATCPDCCPEAVTALPEDTEVWKIRDVSLKAWAACGHIQACIDAALSVSTRIDVGSIESVAVKTYRDAIQFADCESPRNDLEYKFSLQHAAAAGLSGHTNVLDFSKRSAENIGIVKLRRKIQLQLGAPSGVDPTEAWGAEVVARTSDGGEVSCISTEPKGSTTNPMTTKEVRAKFDDLAAYGGIPHGTSAKLADDVLALTAGGDLSLFLGDLMNVSTWLSGTELHQMPPHGRAIRSVEGEASVQVHTANSAEVQ